MTQGEKNGNATIQRKNTKQNQKEKKRTEKKENRFVSFHTAI